MSNDITTPITPVQEDQLKRNLDAVLDRFRRAVERGCRKPAEPRLVAVSKRHSLPAILAVARHWRSMGGSPVFGENYMREVVAKQEGAAASGESGLAWHFIGHLQSNKAGQAAGRFELIHTLDSLSLARNLQKTMRKGENTVKNPLLPLRPAKAEAILVQVNVGFEESKSGVAPDDLKNFLTELQGFGELNIQGLMILPPFSENPEDTRPYFIRLRQMRDRLENELGMKLPHLSMGMSHDFEAAIEEGATLVRVGTDIFGQRQY